MGELTEGVLGGGDGGAEGAMARSAQEQLDAVDASIAEIESSGQSIGINGRTLTRANLAELYKQRTALELKVSRQRGRGQQRVIRLPGSY